MPRWRTANVESSVRAAEDASPAAASAESSEEGSVALVVFAETNSPLVAAQNASTSAIGGFGGGGFAEPESRPASRSASQSTSRGAASAPPSRVAAS